MPICHDVLIRFNREATKAACVRLAEFISLSVRVIEAAGRAAGDAEARAIIFPAVLDYICAFKEVVNTGVSEPRIYSATWSENKSPIAADKSLTDAHGVTHKIEMEMKDELALESYFNHPLHLELVEKFTAAALWEDKVFNPDGKPFAIPFDTERPLTPRTVRDNQPGALDDLSEEGMVQWVGRFRGTFRAGGVAREEDLDSLATTLHHAGRERVAAAIWDAIRRAQERPEGISMDVPSREGE